MLSPWPIVALFMYWVKLPNVLITYSQEENLSLTYSSTCWMSWNGINCYESYFLNRLQMDACVCFSPASDCWINIPTWEACSTLCLIRSTVKGCREQVRMLFTLWHKFKEGLCKNFSFVRRRTWYPRWIAFSLTYIISLVSLVERSNCNSSWFAKTKQTGNPGTKTHTHSELLLTLSSSLCNLIQPQSHSRPSICFDTQFFFQKSIVSAPAPSTKIPTFANPSRTVAHWSSISVPHSAINLLSNTLR